MNTNDSGPGSLRQAILDANASPDLDAIGFSIPGTGVQTIHPLTPLPGITDAVVIDGYTQPGATPNSNGLGLPSNAVLAIELSGTSAGAGASGLVISGSGTTVRGLVINRFTANGINITGSNNTIEGNFVGTNPAGTAALGNGSFAGVSVNFPTASENLVGGTEPAARNVISGNTVFGVLVNASRTTVRGNFIGTDVTGTVALGNANDGIRVGGNGTNAIIGPGNVISGNQGTGVQVGSTGPTTLDAQVLGNLIGTNAAGTTRIANRIGVSVVGSSGNTIGGMNPGDGNVISGNLSTGLQICAGVFSCPTPASNNVVQGNIIGLNGTGTASLPNASSVTSTASGVSIDGATDNTIGGTRTSARNIVSGNRISGIGLTNGATSNVIEGNYIGTDPTGTTAIGNAQSGSGSGVSINGASNNIIGGSAPGAANVISGNLGTGISICANPNRPGAPCSAPADGNLVQGNPIGTDPTGTSALGNGHDGVSVNAASANTFDRNTIAFSGGNGVIITAGTGNMMTANSIYANVNLGIDLGGDGVTSNDALDTDPGANNLQNYPMLTAAATGGTSTVVAGTFNSLPNARFRLQFFQSAQCDPSGFGEGQKFVSSVEVTTDAAGNAPVLLIPLPSVPVGQVITATAIDLSVISGDTSEFSNCARNAPAVPGRMTGGGGITGIGGIQVTHGFELHCNSSVGPNNLEINWGQNNFHLDSLTNALCADDLTIAANPPAAAFDTYVGSGVGRCNGVPGATAQWRFTDAGEPGKLDTATIVINGTGACSLSVSGTLDNGDEQAHNK